MRLHLRLPAVSARLDPGVETRRVYVEQWIEELPYASPAGLLRAVLGALAALNRNPLHYRNRLELLELHLRPYQYLLDLVRGHGAVHTMAAFERHRGETDATRRVATELAYGYKLVLSETVGVGWRARKEAALAVHRAVACICQVLLHSYHEYLPTPPHVWSELWELHRYARKCGLADAAAPGGVSSPDLDPPIDAHYKAILVTSLVDPYHLAYADVWKVHPFILARVGGVRLHSPEPLERTAGVYWVAPGVDRGPSPYRSGDPPPAEGLLLNTRGMLTGLQRRLDELRTTPGEQRRGSAAVLEARLAERILVALGCPPERRDARERAGDRITLATGLATVHYFLRGGPVPGRFAQPEDEIELSGDALPGKGMNFADHTYAAEQWDRVDSGSRGIGIVRATRPSHAVGVGDLVGVSETEDAWSVGVLRWLKVAGDGTYQAGVELLSSGAIAVTLRAQDEVPGEAAPEIGLWLADPSGPPLLVLGAGLFEPGRPLLAESAEGTVRMVCRARRESLAGCDVVECALLG